MNRVIERPDLPRRLTAAPAGTWLLVIAVATCLIAPDDRSLTVAAGRTVGDDRAQHGEGASWKPGFSLGQEE